MSALYGERTPERPEDPFYAYHQPHYGGVLAGVFRSQTLESSRVAHPNVSSLKAGIVVPKLPDVPFTAVLSTDGVRRTTLNVYSNEPEKFTPGLLGWESREAELLVSSVASRFNKARQEVIEGVDDWRYGITVLEPENYDGKPPIWPDISIQSIVHSFVSGEVAAITEGYISTLVKICESDPKRMAGIFYFVPGRDRLFASEHNVVTKV